VLIIAAFVTGTFVSASTASAEKGGQFTGIWEAIFGLQTQVDDIDKRLDALENPPSPPALPEADIIVPQGTSVPGCEETNECFVPYEVTVVVGGKVTWSNGDSAAHTVTSGSAGGGPTGVFDSSLFMAGTTFSHTFTDAGTFDYFCMVHPWMNGKIIVK